MMINLFSNRSAWISVILLLIICYLTSCAEPIQNPNSLQFSTTTKTTVTSSQSPNTIIDIASVKNNEKFISRISAAWFSKAGSGTDVTSEVHLLIDVLRCITGKVSIQENTLIITNPDGKSLTVNKDEWMDSCKNSKPTKGYGWSTKALILAKDKQGNPLRNRENSLVIISWAAYDNILMSKNYDVQISQEIGREISEELRVMRDKLQNDYLIAKAQALNDAQKGLPYIEPDINKYKLPDLQTGAVAEKYINTQSVLYLP